MSLQPEVKKFLYDIITAAKNIEEYTSKLEFSDFSQNTMVQSAVERKFEIIGEALNRIGHIDPNTLQKISNHQRIIGFRNIIIHGYDAIDAEIVWDVVINHLPKLINEISILLES